MVRCFPKANFQQQLFLIFFSPFFLPFFFSTPVFGRFAFLVFTFFFAPLFASSAAAHEQWFITLSRVPTELVINIYVYFLLIRYLWNCVVFCGKKEIDKWCRKYGNSTAFIKTTTVIYSRESNIFVFFMLPLSPMLSPFASVVIFCEWHWFRQQWWNY